MFYQSKTSQKPVMYYRTAKLPLITEDDYNEIFIDQASEQVFYEVVPSPTSGKEIGRNSNSRLYIGR